MAKKLYPSIEAFNEGDIAYQLRSLTFFCQDIERMRQDDVDDFNNLQNVFMSGRKVGKTPSGSSDVAATDRVGDFNYDASYFYLCVDNSGATWRRIALGSW